MAARTAARSATRLRRRSWLAALVKGRARGTIPVEHASSASAATRRCCTARRPRLIAEGYLADVNVIDLDRLKLSRPWLAFDLPAGGKRLLQTAEGYDVTIKSGAVTFCGGKLQDARPGRVVRGPQSEPLLMAAE